MRIPVMASTGSLEEKLRECCSLGDAEKVRILVERGVNVNSVHKINGWTALHWAAKRNHKKVVKYLVEEANVDPAIRTISGELAADLTSDQEIRNILGAETSINPLSASQVPLPIVPNYLKSPNFFYADDNNSFETQLKLAEKSKPNGESQSNYCSQTAYNATADLNQPNNGVNSHNLCRSFHCSYCSHQFPAVCRRGSLKVGNDLVVKLRVANCKDEEDFIEVELDRRNLTYTSFVQMCVGELGIQTENIKKIRKLPNTIVRNDKDVLRLQQFQEIEIVLL